MKKIKHFLEYLAAFLIVFVMLLLIASAIVVKFYGDELKDYAMEMVNSQLDTKVSVGDVGISVFRKFPNTSVFLNNVTVWSGHNFVRNEFKGIQTDTLLFADRLYLQFNILDLLRKKYSIKSLEARNGEIHIYIDSQGNSNYAFNKDEAENKKDLLLDIQGVAFRGLSVEFINKAKELEISGTIIETFFEGNFHSNEYMLKINGKSYIERIRDHELMYISGQGLNLDVILNVKDNVYTIGKGEIGLGDLLAGIHGEFLLDKGNGADLNLHLNGKRIDLEWISDILAGNNISLNGIKAKGDADLTVDVTGLVASTLSPHIEAAFFSSAASLSFPDPSIELNGIELKGSYTNGTFNTIRSTTINLEKFHAKSGNSIITISGKLQDLLSPEFSARIGGKLDAKELSDISDKIPIRVKSGTIIPDITIQGKIKGVSSTNKEISIVPAGNIQIKELAFVLEPEEIQLHSVNGSLDISPKTVAVKLNGFFFESDFRTDLLLSNPFTVSTSHPALAISGSLYSSDLDVDKILSSFHRDDEGEKSILFPENLNLNLDFQFDRIRKGEIQTKKVTGSLIYKYPGLSLEPVYLETMNGNINARLAVTDLNLPTHMVSLNANYRNVEIRDIFTSFNNFGQGFLTADNIAGKLSGESELFTRINSDLSIIPPEIVSRSTLIIENGELNNFEPIIELSRFLKIDKMDHIVFSTINNTILISDEQITIPEMTINSTALNIKASGTHGFDNTFEYHLATKLSEILFSKAKSSRNKEFDIALDQEDMRTIFLLLYDEGKGMVIDFDDDQALKKIRQDLKNEKTELKTILNKELGLFKKDEELQKNDQEIEEPGMKFEFSDGDTIPAESPKTEQESKWWKRKKVEDKKPDLEFVLDEE